MRILIVSQYFWPENFRVNDLAVDLVKKGHSVTVLTGIPNYPDGQVFDAYKKDANLFATFDGVNIFRVPIITRGKGSLRLVCNYLSFVLTACVIGPWLLRRREFDVVFVNQLSPITVALPAAFIAWMKKAPMVMWVLDLWPHTLQAVGIITSRRLLHIMNVLVSYIYRRCDLVLTQSKSFIAVIREMAPEGLRIEYMPSWAEEVFQDIAMSPVPEIPVAKDSFDVMFAGNIGEAQDFPCILGAAEILKPYLNIRWLIVGDGRMRKWVEEEVRRRGLSSQVLLLGRFPVERMPSFFKSAHALLVTLQDKPIFGMTIPGKVQSYLSAGRPLVAALNGEGALLIKESGAGYVVPSGDAVKLADAVLRLSRISANERMAMAENGKKTNEREFKRDVVLERFESALNSVVANFENKLFIGK